MKIETLPNKSVIVTSDMPHEAPIVMQFRQFAIGEKVLYNGCKYTVFDVDTIVRHYSIFNAYHLGTEWYVSEYQMLLENPRKCPDNILDALVDYLPVVTPFVTSDNRVFVTEVKS